MDAVHHGGAALRAGAGGRPDRGVHLRRQGFDAAGEADAGARTAWAYALRGGVSLHGPGLQRANRAKIERNAALLHIPLEIFETDIFAAANATDRSPCYLCARMRRGHLYAEARRRGCNKIALGHHFNDVIETTVMGLFWSSQLQAMPPKLHSRNFPGMELIRPMYCIHEDDVLAWKRYNGLEFLECACRFTENRAMYGNGGGGKRQETKTLLRRLRRDNPNIEKSIFHALHGVSLDTFPGYKTGGEEHSFLENYCDGDSAR